MPNSDASAGIGLDSANPQSSTGSATRKPAIGPAMPISNSALRERMGDLMRISAPKVPISVGAGMKYGSVAYTPFLSASNEVPELVRQQESPSASARTEFPSAGGPVSAAIQRMGNSGSEKLSVVKAGKSCRKLYCRRAPTTSVVKMRQQQQQQVQPVTPLLRGRSAAKT